MSLPSQKRRIFLLSDHPVARYGMAQMINAEADLIVCGESSTIAASVTDSDPELLVWDLQGLGVAAEESVRAWHRKFPFPRILATGDTVELQSILGILRAGAGSYVGSKETLSQFLQGIRQTLEGKVYLNPTYGEQLILSVTRNPDGPWQNNLARLTAREREVLELIGKGSNNRQIAELCQVSPKTVESHRLRIREKLGLRNSAELMRTAVTFLAGGGQAEGVH